MKKGFTLIELIAILVIVAVIVIIGLPNLLGTTERQEEKNYNDFLENLYIATENYLVFDDELLSKLNNNGVIYVIIETLRYEGYIKGEAVNPKTELEVRDEHGIKVTKNSNGSYNYEYVLEIPESNDESGANDPILASNMIPVKWNGSTWIKANVINNKGEYSWYNYDRQMWANAVIVTEGTRTNYQNAAIGTVINMSDILTMMVWIPRFEYRQDNLGINYAGGSQTQPGGIEINFITEVSTATTTNYRMHPGFTFGTEELRGFWISKFETTGSYSSACTTETCTTASITSKPNISSITGQTLSSYWYGIRSMQRSGNQYGYNSNVDIHLIKNSEWGAVAYLSQSKYGKHGNSDYSGVNKEIYLNNSTVAGESSGVPAGTTSSVACEYNGSNNRGNGTGACGTGASTTGTIYGVYDMVGGRYDYVMANYNNTLGSSGFTSLPDSKYYDSYTTTSVATACNGSVCYGHALSETAGWYGDTNTFVTATYPWLTRGSISSANSNIAGIFATMQFTGAPAKVAFETARIVHK